MKNNLTSDQAQLVNQAKNILSLDDQKQNAMQTLKKINTAQAIQDEQQRHQNLIHTADSNSVKLREFWGDIQREVRNKQKEIAIEDNRQVQIELVRRKLDFGVIKDNYDNKATKAILEKFTDLDKGMPGTDYKHIKIRELINEYKTQREQLKQ